MQRQFILEQIMQVFHRYPQNTEEIPKKKYLLPIHLTFIDNLFTTTTVVLTEIQLCFPAGPSSGAVKGVGLRSLTCCDRGFESHPGNGCLSVVSVVCCQVEVSAAD
jgi:hypothetical protein